MPTQLSAGVNVSEINLTTIVPAVSTSIGAIGGIFGWGPVGERINVGSESILASTFGKPSNLNAETWFTAANFLGYSNQLVVARAANTSGATPFGSFYSAANGSSSNNVFTGNTSGLVNGMFIAQTSNASIVPAGNSVTISSVNATAFVLSQNVSTNTAVTLYFGNPGTSYSAVALASSSAVVANLVNQIVPNIDVYNGSNTSFDTNVLYIAKYPGGLGNSLRVAVCDDATSFQSNVSLTGNATWNTVSFAVTTGSSNGTLLVSNGSATNAAGNSYATTLATSFTVGDLLYLGNTSVGQQYVQITSIGPAVSNATVSSVAFTFQDPYRLATNYTETSTLQRFWEFSRILGTAPGQSSFVTMFGNTAANDEMHVVIVDNDGGFTGTPGAVLEVYKGLSRATDAKNADTTTNYYKTVLNQQSQYIWWANDRSGAASANAQNIVTSTAVAPLSLNLVLGTDGYTEATAPLSVISKAYDLFNSAERVDIDIVLQGKGIGGSTLSGGQTVSNYLLANYIIDNILTVRKDCVAAITPDISTSVFNVGQEVSSMVNWRNVLHNTSYAILDSGYKYQYDRYNDIYRWIPLNGDLGGLCARTDQTNDAWWSPAGFNRGQIKNLVKLAFNPSKPDRDILYTAGINPITTFPGQGTVLFGDKTLEAKPSAFDRINVRRLFIVLEKAISLASQYSLFEFNDDFTRRQFVNLITPYLRDVQGRRGITDFQVVCDATNNTPQVIDSNQFVGDIYIKPARSINFIQLNFVAVGTGVQFSEVIGSF